MNTTALSSVLLLVALAVAGTRARASVAYGSINNFDTVNDTGVEAHGFEIELENCHSADISYTFDWNHYGTPSITEDNLLGFPRTTIRWASKKNPDGTWAAYTAIPSGPIAPTDGHMFTDPSVNFGGEHFGTGFLVQPSAVRYHWLIDDGYGGLKAGLPVQVATPSFTYIPAPAPVPDVPPVPARVVAEIVPPEPAQPEEVLPPVKEFGDAVWVKEIRTEKHNGNEVELRNLVSDDPDNAADKNWANGEPDEVEVEWQILQKDYNKGQGGGANAVLAGAAEDLTDGDEVITRRYEFFKYIGPIDSDTGEAMAQNVGADGIHGEGVKTINGVEVDLSTVEVVGEFAGSQMAAFDAAATVGLIDHLQDGIENEPYPDRRVIIAGTAAFTATCTGDLPEGMSFDAVSGILSGTPVASGTFTISVTAVDGAGPDATKSYTLQIAPAGVELPQQYVVDTSVWPPGGGFASGGGAFTPDAGATVVASAQAGFAFAGWKENGALVSAAPSYAPTLNMNHSLVAYFVPAPVVTTSTPAPGTFRMSWPANPPGWILQESPDMSPGSWTNSTRVVPEVGGVKQMTIPNPAGKVFFRLYSYLP